MQSYIKLVCSCYVKENPATTHLRETEELVIPWPQAEMLFFTETNLSWFYFIFQTSSPF